MRPRDAATLVLLREGTAGLEVLMGRRVAAHRFMPNMYVFPGGRIDPADAKAPVLRDLAPDVAARLGRQARAIGVAAIRETHEETGLVLGREVDGRVEADLSGLDVLARAITPPDSPIRFHARFLVARAEGATGTLGGSGELVELGFRPLDEALRLPLADITEFILQDLARDGIGRRPTVKLYSYRRNRPVIRHG
ncbi:MAG: NUDIX domain-containing protein [Alphaproteobacteria bacterium]|nr:NUDIX domain-containing protein [Alphaproteobacteria bacterium]